MSARYVPAASGIDVGGDWYDVVATDERQVLLVIGDVSGHGPARRDDDGARCAMPRSPMRRRSPIRRAVLTKLSDFVNSGAHDYFATVLCALIDVDAHRLTIASAGHMAPLLIDGDDSRYVQLDANVPIGVARDSRLSGERRSPWPRTPRW